MSQNNIPTSEYFSGQGNLLLAEIVNGVVQGFRHVGNVPALTITGEQTTLEHKESTSGQRATDLRLTQETKVGMNFTAENMDADNLALLSYGDKASVTGASVTAEVITARLGYTIGLAHIDVSNVVVTDNATGTVTYVEGTDYTVNAEVGSINVLSTGNISDAELLDVDYDFGDQTEVRALTQSRKTYAARFEGLNTVDGKAVLVEINKVSPDLLKELALINDELGSAEIEASMYYDATKPTNPYYKVTKP